MKKINNNRGVAMVAVLTIMFVAAILSVALFTYSSEQLMQARRNQDEMQAKYLSRAGVEATLSAYNELDTSFTSGNYDVTNPLVLTTTYTYLAEDSSGDLVYKTYDPTVGVSSIPADEEIRGYYTVTVTYPAQEDLNGDLIETVRYSCTAVSGGATTVSRGATPTPTNDGGVWKTSEAYVAASTTGAKNAGPSELKWYDDTGTINVSNSELKTTSYVIDGNSVKAFTDSGVVNFESPDVSQGYSFNLRLGGAVAYNNANNKIAIGAQTLYMNMPIDLQSYVNGEEQVLVLSAGDIIINEQVDLYIYYRLISSAARGGTMAIGVTDDMATTDPYTGEACGKIYFNEDVFITARTLFNSTRITLFNKGDVYYFKQKSGTTGSLNQIDLIKFWRDTVHTDDDDLGWLANLIDQAYASSSAEDYLPTDMRKIGTAPCDTPEDLVPPKAVDASYLVWK